MKSGSRGCGAGWLNPAQIAGLALILLAGAGYIWWRIHAVDRDLREDLLERTRLMAQAVNLERMRQFNGSENDLELAEYHRLKDQLELLHSVNPDVRLIYLVGRKPDGSLFFFVDSASGDSSRSSRPGVGFDENSETFKQALAKSSGIVEGPDRDRGGHWLSAMVPVEDRLDGRTIAGFGVDLDAGEWRRLLLAAAWPGAAMTLLLLGLVAGWMRLCKRRKRPGVTSPRWMSYLHPLGIAMTGVLLTLFVSWRVLHQELRTRNQIFAQLAAGETELVARIIEELRGGELDGLRSFLAHSPVVESIEFHNYCRHLEKNPLVRGWVWIPVVTAEQKDAFETAARRRGDPGFRIWQFNRAGREMAVTLRSVYYPVLYSSSPERNPGVLGFDHGSEPARLSALSESGRSRLPTGTGTIKLLNDQENERGILVYDPVFDPDGGGRLRGFAMIAIRMSTLLSRSDAKSALTHSELAMLRRDAPPEMIAAKGTSASLDGTSINRPIFAFGKVFLLTVKPGPEFVRAYPLWKYALTLLIGLCFTGGVAVIVLLVGRRKSELERMVSERTFQLKEREERLLTLAKHSRTLIWNVDLEGKFTYVNDVFESLLGYRSEDLLGRYFYEIYPEFRREFVKKMRFEYFKLQQSYNNAEDRVQARDGHLVWISSNGMPLFDPAGKMVGYSGACTDISNRKEAEAGLLRQSEFQKMLSHIASSCINLPLDRIDAAINQSLGELGRLFDVDRFYVFAYDFEGQCCSNTHEWCAPGISPQLENMQNLPFADFQQWIELTCRGEIVDIPDVEAMDHGEPLKKILQSQDIRSLLCVPLMSEGQCFGFVGFDSVRSHHRYTAEEVNLLQAFADMLVNIRSRRETEEELLRRGRAAEAANRAKSEFLTNMSHEIRTPMNGVVGVSEMLAGTNLDAEQKNYLEIIRSSGKLMLELVNELLDYARIETGRIQVEQTEFNLDDLLDGVVGALIPAAHHKNLELIVAVSPRIPERLSGDLLHLQQILMNLCGNAVKFTDRGEVAIQVALEAESDDSVTLRFAVRDTGIGISKEQCGALFEAFHQIDPSVSRRYGGAGLGLAIARRLVGLLGGELNVTSEPGIGSEFSFSSPLAKVAGAGSKEPEHPAKWRECRILAADDNGSVRQLLRDELNYRAFRVECAADIQSALALLADGVLKGDPFRAMLIDLELFGAGLEASLAAIISDPQLNGVALIAMLRPGCLLDEAHLRRLGFAAVLNKPVRGANLDRVLNAVIDVGPAAEPASPAAPAPGPVPGAAQSDILLAEDNSTNQKVMLLMLRKLGLRTDVAENGFAVLNLLAVNSYRAVLMDIQMPEMDGLEATRRIRDPASRVLDHRIPIIAVTAHAVAGYQESCREAGMDDYLAKPVTPAALRQTLSRWIFLP